jgi:hypothetical protein
LFEYGGADIPKGLQGRPFRKSMTTCRVGAPPVDKRALSWAFIKTSRTMKITLLALFFALLVYAHAQTSVPYMTIV